MKRKHDDDEWKKSKRSRTNWLRNPIPVDFDSRDLIFQMMTLDYTVVDPVKGFSALTSDTVPVIRLYGVNEFGNSIKVAVHGFCPYFYVPAPDGFGEKHCSAFRIALDKKLEEAIRSKEKRTAYVMKISIVKKQSIYYYEPVSDPNRKFIKITLIIPRHVPTARAILESSFSFSGFEDLSYSTYESNLAFILRFMIDRGIVGCGWICIKAGKYEPLYLESRCQIEVIALASDVNCLPVDGVYSKLAPLRILSFDIECAAPKGQFPDPKHDSVIQIANIVTTQGESDAFVKNVMMTRTSIPIAGVEILSFTEEMDMLLAWSKFIQEVDPDVIIGYNTTNFDFPYLVNRAKTLKITEFLELGRNRGILSRLKDTTFSSKAYGTRESKETSMDGRVQLDLLQVIQRQFKLSSYTLNNVSAHFLGEQKEDVHHSMITTLFNGTDHDRNRLARYCFKDAYLPQRLLDKLMILYQFVEMARVTGVPMDYLLTRGQSIKVVSQIYRIANKEDLVIPVLSKREGTDATYKGATVIEPEKGFYKDPIVTLDFASLYPSIMISHNLCYSSLVRPSDVKKLKPEAYEKTPAGHCFVKKTTHPGLLPRILEELLSARKRAKGDLAKATDPLEKAVLDGRQLALKISANSVYGFTGATIGTLPCLQVSSSVTAYGREMLELTKQVVQDHFCIKNGYERDARVIYGDSVTGDTPILVKDAKGNVHIIAIDEIETLGDAQNWSK